MVTELETDINLSERCYQSADNIYYAIWGPEITINRFTWSNEANPLDKDYGIDVIISIKGGPSFTIQEKFRDNRALFFHDLTFEYMNGNGTTGEWQHGVAGYLLYAWENKTNDGSFADWVFIDYQKLRAIINQKGGLQAIGQIQHNRQHGTSIFYSIPLSFLVENKCIVTRATKTFLQNFKNN